MTVLAIVVCVICQLCLVGGHLLLKHAMNATHCVPPPRRLIMGTLSGGIGLLSLWFFLWLGLLREWELSRVFPFDGLGPPLLVLSAWLFLKERVSPRAWVGIVLIGLGVALVAGD